MAAAVSVRECFKSLNTTTTTTKNVQAHNYRPHEMLDCYTWRGGVASCRHLSLINIFCCWGWVYLVFRTNKFIYILHLNVSKIKVLILQNFFKIMVAAAAGWPPCFHSNEPHLLNQIYSFNIIIIILCACCQWPPTPHPPAQCVLASIVLNWMDMPLVYAAAAASNRTLETTWIN